MMEILLDYVLIKSPYTVKSKLLRISRFCIQLRILSREVLLNKLFYRFHTKRDDLAIGICERFPINGHLHTNCGSFPTQKFCRIRYSSLQSKNLVKFCAHISPIFSCQVTYKVDAVHYQLFELIWGNGC